MQIFEGISFFKATNNTKTNELAAARWVLPEGCVLLSERTQLACTHPSGRTQLATAKLFACFCIVRDFEEKDSLKKSHSVLFCLIRKRSV